MSSNFLYSSRDHKFIFKEWLDLNKVLATERFKDGYTVDDVDFILDNALKGAREVIAPSCADSDQKGAHFADGRVTTEQSTKDAYWFIQKNGFGATNYDPQEPSAVPLCLFWAFTEYFIGANPALGTLILGAGSGANIIREFGDEKLKATYLPKLFSGEWNATMNLTEPAAGSDVGALTTRAIPTDTPGVYRIKGTKCFISGGEQDINENIVHLVLARIDGAAKGTAGISLFVVPKYLPDENGNVGAFNGVRCGGIEHKLGLKGNPTCVMNYGEEDDCIGFLLGDPPGPDGIGKGMMQMFNLMNEERLMTGHAACACASVAYNNAADYARQRIQGRTTYEPKAGPAPIIKHEDIRRMLMFQKAYIEAFRAMIYNTFYMIDIKNNTADKQEKMKVTALIEVNTPIVKAFVSDMALECISNALQIYGGYGFSEEYPVAELYRDARIYPIWEGTNYIQSMDLVGRKMTIKDGMLFKFWLQEIKSFISDHEGTPGFETEFERLGKAYADYEELLGVYNGYRAEGKEHLVKLYATRVLHATGKLYAGKLLLEMALIAQRKIDELGTDHYDYTFYQGKVASARFFAANILPEIAATAEIIKRCDTTALEIDESIFGA